MNNNLKKYLPIILSVFVASAVIITAVIVALLKKNTPEEEGNDIYVHKKELGDTKGVFVPSVYNISFPSKKDMTKEELKAELEEIVENTKKAGLNSIFFQVRPACDALYQSEIFPVSSYLSSSGDLTLDCLEYMTEICHKNNISIHAWINPLRVSCNGTDLSVLPKGSPAAEMADYVVAYGDKLYFDPGYPEVRELICRGVEEICKKYDVDGIIFDDYFYPYKIYETLDDGTRVAAAFADEAAFSKFGSSFDSVDDFRRDNINNLIKSVYERVKKTNKDCFFGVSCFGIWKNQNGENGGSYTKGSESFNETYSDTLSWVEGGYVDYIAPQIYWETSNTAASYKVLSKWWDLKLEGSGVSLLIAHAAYKYDGTFDSASKEMTTQLAITEALSNYKGSIFYGYNAIRDNLGGITDEIKAYYESGKTEGSETEDEK